MDGFLLPHKKRLHPGCDVEVVDKVVLTSSDDCV